DSARGDPGACAAVAPGGVVWGTVVGVFELRPISIPSSMAAISATTPRAIFITLLDMANSSRCLQLDPRPQRPGSTTNNVESRLRYRYPYCAPSFETLTGAKSK